MSNIEATKEVVLNALQDKKARDVNSISMPKNSSLGELMIVASGNSARNVKAITDNLVWQLKHQLNILSVAEGGEDCQWLVVDIGDIIIHVLTPDNREYYSLEDLWQASGGAIG